jgi:hypothetical protein
MSTPYATALEQLGQALASHGVPEPAETAWAALWLEACGYPGLDILAEALADERRDLALCRDALGLDLQSVSCVFLAGDIMAELRAGGRVFLRNVRHGLFLLPFAVKENVGLGCPIDPAFAIGGERLKNPYGEKLAAAMATGLDIDEALWQRLTGKLSSGEI